MRAAVGDAEAVDSGEDSRIHDEAGAGVERGRADERTVCDPARHGVRTGSESAGVTNDSLCEQGDRRAAGESSGAVDDRAEIARFEFAVHENQWSDGTDGAEFLCGEIAGVSVQQVSRRGYDSGAGDAVDGRGDGNFVDVRAGVCEGATGGGAAVAAAGDGVLERERSRQAACGVCGAGFAGGGIEGGGDARDGGGAGERGD